jgi:hypothetical protein
MDSRFELFSKLIDSEKKDFVDSSFDYLNLSNMLS